MSKKFMILIQWCDAGQVTVEPQWTEALGGVLRTRSLQLPPCFAWPRLGRPRVYISTLFAMSTSTGTLLLLGLTLLLNFFRAFIWQRKSRERNSSSADSLFKRTQPEGLALDKELRIRSRTLLSMSGAQIRDESLASPRMHIGREGNDKQNTQDLNLASQEDVGIPSSVFTVTTATPNGWPLMLHLEPGALSGSLWWSLGAVSQNWDRKPGVGCVCGCAEEARTTDEKNTSTLLKQGRCKAR